MRQFFSIFNKPSKAIELQADFGTYRLIAPRDSVVPAEFISIPLRDIQYYAKVYSRLLETGQTAEWCKCLWRIHPDDVNVKPGRCRECGNVESDHDDHRFLGIRKTLVDVQENCPVHTSEGKLTYFFEWIEKQQ